MPYKNVCRKKKTVEESQHLAEMRIRQTERNRKLAEEWRQARLEREKQTES